LNGTLHATSDSFFDPKTPRSICRWRIRPPARENFFFHLISADLESGDILDMKMGSKSSVYYSSISSSERFKVTSSEVELLMILTNKRSDIRKLSISYYALDDGE
jgi:hypothetical protein